MKNRKLVRIFVVITLIAALLFLGHGYSVSSQQLAAERVFKTCGGDYITVKSLGPGVNPGGPCLASDSFVLKRNNSMFYASIGVLGVVLVLDVILINKYKLLSGLKR